MLAVVAAAIPGWLLGLLATIMLGGPANTLLERLMDDKKGLGDPEFEFQKELAGKQAEEAKETRQAKLRLAAAENEASRRQDVSAIRLSGEAGKAQALERLGTPTYSGGPSAMSAMSPATFHDLIGMTF